MNLQLPRVGTAPDAPFPDTKTALSNPNGLLAWGGDFNLTRMMAAYRRGIFPWSAAEEPILWWSPHPRCVIEPANVHVSKRTRRRHHSGIFHITADTAFESVITGCAAPRREDAGTWITTPLREAFVALHRGGNAHSVEVWRGDSLVGGIYGLAIGRMFFGESMFSREPDASKLALVALCKQLQAWNFPLLDCQVPNPHLRSMGAIRLPRKDFETRLAEAIQLPFEVGSWAQRFEVDARW